MDAIIEIPLHSHYKFEIDKDNNLLRLDRLLKTSMVYPGNYGYYPKTLGGDGDPLDVIMLVDYQIPPMTILKVRPVGVLVMRDEAGLDEKILVVPDDKVDKSYCHIKNLKDVKKEKLDMIEHFFSHYKDLSPGKFVKIEGWKGKKEAEKIIKESILNYHQNSKKNTDNKSNKKSNKKSKRSNKRSDKKNK